MTREDPTAANYTEDAPTLSAADETDVAATADFDAIDLKDQAYYFNRELSWLRFNERVLELAEDADEPLLERLKFAAINAANLDEFFMIRVAGLDDLIDAGVEKRGPDGRTPLETVAEVREIIQDHLARLTTCVESELLPALAEHGPRIVHMPELSITQRQEMREHFMAAIFPVLTPLAVGPGRPFPYISNLSLSLAVLLRDPSSDQNTFARVKVPTEILPRFVPVGETNALIPLEDVIADNLQALFPGTEIVAVAPFRVTRDADFTVSDEADDLVRAVEQELRRRRFGEVVRIEVGEAVDDEMRVALTEALEVEDRELFEVGGMLDLGDLWNIVRMPGFSEMRYEPWTPTAHPRLIDADGEQVPVMAAMRQGDILVHHPYDSFASSVERFVEEAVDDPDVLAIKQTVYRTSDDSPLVPSLIRASEKGKQAVCLVELKARFDEQANIQWAKSLEQAGVHVVYGHPGLKTHAKCVMVVRREAGGVRHYVHIGTGNYHSATARLYTDFGLFTTDQRIGADVADMFNFLTGFARPRAMRKVLLAPHGLREGILEEIQQTIDAAAAGADCRIVLKMNSLVDKRCIRALYRASQAGVPVDLNIRGVCCLRPGVHGVSENIRVVSVVGRWLEHSRVFAFQRGSDTAVYIGSADLMPRNLDNRVELAAPVEAPDLKTQLLDTLERCMADDNYAWELAEDGAWNRRQPADISGRNAQAELMELHRLRLNG